MKCLRWEGIITEKGSTDVHVHVHVYVCESGPNGDLGQCMDRTRRRARARARLFICSVALQDYLHAALISPRRDVLLKCAAQ